MRRRFQRILVASSLVVGAAVASGAAALSRPVTMPHGAGVKQALGGRVPRSVTPTSAFGTTPTVNPSSDKDVLYGIAGATPADIWSVGQRDDALHNYQYRTLIEHYDGSAWRLVSSPNAHYPGAVFNGLYGVNAIGAGDVWSVGYSSDGSAYRTLTEHWNGTRWTIVPSPNPAGTGSLNALFDVLGLSSNNVYAVGGAGSYLKPLILHWDGTAWSAVANQCNRFGSLTGIAAISPTDIWAVGDGFSQTYAFSCHFDGTTWKHVSVPKKAGFTAVFDVAAIASNDVWGVGYYQIETPLGAQNFSYTIHWDGTSWKFFPAPGEQLHGVVAFGSNDVWASGISDQATTEIVHWDGRSWTRVPTPTRGTFEQLNDIVSVGGQLWSAGSYSPPNSGRIRTLVAMAPSTTQGGIDGHTNVTDQIGGTVTWIGPQNGSTSTDENGNYYIGGLRAGQYSITVSAPGSGCTPKGANVNITAGTVLVMDFHLRCPRR